jgi:hypothetical protein
MTMLKSEIKKQMYKLLNADLHGEFLYHGEINCTRLAEETAQVMEHDEWLDDPDHIIWDVAVEVSESIDLNNIVKYFDRVD